MSTLVFLYMNRKWIDADPTSLYRLTVWVASSPAEFKDEVVAAIRKYLHRHLSEAVT